MIPTLIKWAGYLCLAAATVPVALSIWAAVQQNVWGAFSFVSAFVPGIAGVALLGLSRLMDDIAAVRRLVEEQEERARQPREA